MMRTNRRHQGFAVRFQGCGEAIKSSRFRPAGGDPRTAREALDCVLATVKGEALSRLALLTDGEFEAVVIEDGAPLHANGMPMKVHTFTLRVSPKPLVRMSGRIEYPKSVREGSRHPDTPIGAYTGMPHKTIEELVTMARERAKQDGAIGYRIVQDLVDGYSLGWGSANHRAIEEAVKT